MTKDDWTEDEWGEEAIEAEAQPSRLARLRASPWRPFAYGAAAGAVLLAGLFAAGSLTGGGSVEPSGPTQGERALSAPRAAVFAPGPTAFQEEPPLRSGFVFGDALETGDVPPRADLGGRLPPPPAFVRPGDWEESGVLADPPAAVRAAAPPSLETEGLDSPGRADPQHLEALSLDSETLAPPRDALEAPMMETDSGPPPAASAPLAAPAAAPASGAAFGGAALGGAAAEPSPQAAAPARSEAPLEAPTPRLKPPAPEKAAPEKAALEPQDPDVYSPFGAEALAAPPAVPSAPAAAAPAPEAVSAAVSEAVPPRKGWGGRVKLERAGESRLAAGPPIHDPGSPAAGAAMRPVRDSADAGGPVHDPEAARRAEAPAQAAAPLAPPLAAESAPEPAPKTAAEAAPMISASVAFGAEFGPELSPEAFSALDLSAEALATGDLPKVRVAPIDRPDDGPFSARSETPAAAAPEPRRRTAASGPALPKDAPRATVILTALGLHEATTLRAIRETPDEVALAFAPIGRRVEARVADLRAQGRTALIEAPMEAMSRASTPEDLTLSTAADAAENQARLGRVLAIAPQASGISTYMGARFTADSGALAGVLPMLAQRGLFVLENQPTNRSLLREAARGAGIPYAAAPALLDREGDAASIRAALARLERQALADGEAVGVMAASSAALDALALWTDGLASRGVRLAPLAEALE